jgi:hypothetical protein
MRHASRAAFRALTAALALFPLGAGSAVAQSSEPPPTAQPERALLAAAVRRVGDIAVDGRLDEAEWGRARPLQGFVASDPVEGVPAEHETDVYVLYDVDAIYVGARMHDSDPESIFRQLTRRDQLGEVADYFGISLDTNLDRRTAYTFQVSAAGVQADEYRFDDTSRDTSWDAVWESAVSIDPEGWTAELRIPLSQLRFAPSASPQAWGLNAARRRNASAEQSYWALESRVQQGGVSVFGELAGLDFPSGVRALEVRPYALLKRHAALAEPGNPFFDGTDHGFNGGLDVRYGLGSTFVLDATFNPDFGQVEVDPAVINLTALETTYPERRPFFTQGQELFNVRNMFYSRRIGRAPQGRAPSGSLFVDAPEETTILGAGKLTGRTAGGLTIGALAAVTGAETGTAYLDDGTYEPYDAEPRTLYAAAAVQQDLRDGASQVRGIGTLVRRDLPEDGSLDWLASSAVGGGFSFDHSWANRGWGLFGFMVGTYVTGSTTALTRIQREPHHYFQRPDAHDLEVDSTATSIAGVDWRLQLEKRSGTWLPSVWLAEITPGFEQNDLGQGQTNERLDGGARLVYRDITPGEVLRNYSLNVSSIHNFRHEALDDAFNLSHWFDRAIQAGRYTFQGNATLLNYWAGNLGVTFRRKVLREAPTRGGPLMVEPAAWTFNLGVNTDRRQAFSVSPSISYEAEKGDGNNLRIGTQFSWRPTAAAEISVEPEYVRSHNSAQYVTTAANVGYVPTYGSRYVFSDLERREVALPIRVNWIFSPTLSLELFAQPLLSSGDFVSYKQLERASSFDFDVFEEGSAVESGSTVSCEGGRTCVLDGRRYIDVDGTGANTVSFADRDFNQRSLRGSTVLRWEYRPGSTLYLVWQQNRTGRESLGDFDFGRDAEALFEAQPENTFMLKINYWLGM